jgi:hypothetical protein
MPLSITIITCRGVWQSSDIDDPAIETLRAAEKRFPRSMFAKCKDGKALITYTGATRFGFQTLAERLVEKLKGKARTLAELFVTIRDNTTELFNEFRIAGKGSHAFSIGGIRKNQLFSAQINNLGQQFCSPIPPRHDSTGAPFHKGVFLIRNEFQITPERAHNKYSAWATGTNGFDVDDWAMLEREAMRPDMTPKSLRAALAEAHRRVSLHLEFGKGVQPHCYVEYMPADDAPNESELFVWRDGVRAEDLTPSPVTIEPISVGDARVKIIRAKDLLEELDGVTKEYLKLQPFKVVTNDESHAGNLVFRVYRSLIDPPVPDRCGAILGDIVHNLHSALDLLAWQLVLSNGEMPGQGTYFPIGASQESFDNDVNRKLKGADPKAIELVRSLKPYAGGNDLLYKLHRLDIIDKHRVLLVVGAAYRTLSVAFEMKLTLPGREPVTTTTKGMPLSPQRVFPLENGTVLLKDQIDGLPDPHGDLSMSENAFPTIKELGSASSGGGSLTAARIPTFQYELAIGAEDAVVNGVPLRGTIVSLIEEVSRIVELVASSAPFG